MVGYHRSRTQVVGGGPVLYARIRSGRWQNWLLSNILRLGYARAYAIAGADRIYIPAYFVDLPRLSVHFPYGYDVEPDVP